MSLSFSEPETPSTHEQLLKLSGFRAQEVLQTMTSAESPTKPLIDALIIVCCHAIWLGDNPSTDAENTAEDDWLIEPFQAGETSTFISHMQAGIQELLADPGAILVFSGGPTKPTRSDRSEAESYNLYARAHNLFPVQADILERVFEDNYATDSFQNVLFPLLQFPRFVEQYKPRAFRDHQKQVQASCRPPLVQEPFPRHLTVVGHEFKRARFQDLHLPAIKYPISAPRFRYLGIDPSFNEQKMREIREGDLQRGYGAWKNDLYGQNRLLAAKREARGWTKERRAEFQRNVGAGLAVLGIAEGEMRKKVLEYTALVEVVGFESTTVPFPDKVPWAD